MTLDMKALFCHDHHYYKSEGQTLSKGQYHNNVWQRYLNHFNHLTVVGRHGGIHHGDVSGMNIASTDRVSFELLADTNSFSGMMFGRRKLRETLKLLVSDHDVVIIRGVSEIGYMAYCEAKKQGKRVVMEMVACAWDELWYHGSIKAKLYAPYRFLMARRMAHSVDAIIYVSQRFLQNRYPSNAPLQAAASNVQIEKDSCTAISPPTHDYYKIGLIGTLKNRLKGVHVAIQAASILKKRGTKPFKIHILGPGDPTADPCQFQQMAMRYGVQNNIVFDGIRTSGAPVLEWIQDLNLYIQPSFQEGVPRAVIETMSQSRAVIGSDAGGIAELLDDDCIIRRGDANGLANKIEWMMNNASIQEKKAARNFVESQKYTMDQLLPIREQFWGAVASMALPYQTK